MKKTIFRAGVLVLGACALSMTGCTAKQWSNADILPPVWLDSKGACSDLDPASQSRCIAQRGPSSEEYARQRDQLRR